MCSIFASSENLLEADSSPPFSPVSAEPLPEEIPLDSLKAVLPSLGNGESSHQSGRGNKNITMGRNMHGSCLEITEPEMDDEVTGEKDAYMAGVLARYRKTLVEKTKYHLGACSNREHFLISPHRRPCTILNKRRLCYIYPRH